MYRLAHYMPVAEFLYRMAATLGQILPNNYLCPLLHWAAGNQDLGPFEELGKGPLFVISVFSVGRFAL
jgi:hypothetical protein